MLGVGVVAACSSGTPTDGPADGADAGVDAPVLVAPGRDAAPAPTRDSAPPEPTGLAPLPVLASINPDHATAGSAGPPIIVMGSGFVAASIVQIDGAQLPTDFISDTELHANIPSSKVLRAGTIQLAVGTAPPGGGLSASATFAVLNPAPQLTMIEPQSAAVGASATDLTVIGGAFVSGAAVSFDGAPLTTTYGSLSSLTATIPAAMLGVSGNHAVVVTNPSPGGGASTSIAFVVTNPTVSVTSVSPTSVTVGAPAQALSLTGLGFIAASAVSLNGTTVPSTFVDAAHLTANVPASSFTTVGSFPVVVTNPQPGGGVSTPVTFQVQNPAPTIASLSPSSAATGSGDTPVTITGTGFGAASQVLLGGVAASTTFVDGSHLQATLSSGQLATAGTIAVSVTNPAPGGGTSGTLNFAVSNPAPSIMSLSPSTAPAGSASASLTINGRGFVFGATAQFGATALSTTYVSGVQLTATVPGSLLATAGSVPVTVTNPAPGGGTSNASPFFISCDTTGVDVVLGAVGTVTTRPLVWTGPTSERFPGSGACPQSLPTTSTLPRPYQAFIVMNATASSVTLSTWAVCTSTSGSTPESDAFLGVYRRATVPMSIAERNACTGIVSEGASGTPAAGSPDANGSPWCPGLTAGNGRGMTLAACERAVVYIQPFSTTSTSFTPPAQIRFKPE